MHLLNARTRKLEIFIGRKIPKYAILSHTWGNDEVTFQDLKDNPSVEVKAGYAKIRNTCKQALKDGLDYAWVDTCCIDKSSSSELSEAINSMFRWYEKSAKCYAYLSDVSTNFAAPSNLSDDLDLQKYSGARPKYAVTVNGVHEQVRLRYKGFDISRWFSRGWTLQELIAPKSLEFFDKDWVLIGSRDSILALTVSRITGIERGVFGSSFWLTRTSIAARMSWASRRETTRIEDEAYCLLGIFGVNMPLLYGEGNKAFVRLQEAIMLYSADQSIFAWSFGEPQRWTIPSGQSLQAEIDGSMESGTIFSDILAPGVAAFASCGEIKRGPKANREIGSYHFTYYGLQITLPVVMHTSSNQALAILNCGRDAEWLALRLDLLSDGSGIVQETNVDEERVGYVDAAIARIAKHKKLLLRGKKGLFEDPPWRFSGVHALLLQMPPTNSIGIGVRPQIVVQKLWPEELWDRANSRLSFELAQFNPPRSTRERSLEDKICTGAIGLSFRWRDQEISSLVICFCCKSMFGIYDQRPHIASSVRVRYWLADIADEARRHRSEVITAGSLNYNAMGMGGHADTLILPEIPFKLVAKIEPEDILGIEHLILDVEIEPTELDQTLGGTHAGRSGRA